jgi:adenylate cyclase
VWHDVIATDESLTKCISDVRLALGDGEQKIIKTLPRRGYLFASPIARVTADAAARAEFLPASYPAMDQADASVGAEARPVPTRWRWVAPIGAVLLLAAIGWGTWLWLQQSAPSVPSRPSIAVLPFTTVGAGAQDYLGDGITEDLTTSLSKFADLLVIAQGSAFRYKSRPNEPREVGRELGVRYLLQGSVRDLGEQLRITAQLVDAANDKQIWAEQYDRKPSDIFALQDEVTRKIAVTLVAHLTKSEIDRALRKPPSNLAAYEAYLRGNALLRNMERERAKVIAAKALYEQALAADPRYAPAVHGLANAYFLLWSHPCPGDPSGCEYKQQATFDRARELAQQAVELDGTRTEAYAMLAWLFAFESRFDESIREFERAFAFNPNFIDGRFGLILSHVGRPAEAIDYMKRAMRADPFHPPIYVYWLGKGYFFIGDYDEAFKLIEAASRRLPDHLPSRVLLAAVAGHLGRVEDAKAAAAEALRIDPKLSIGGWLKFMLLARSEDADRLAGGMRRAGLPE